MIETTKLYYSNIISFLAVHTVTTDSAKICFNVCMHMKVTWEPSKKWNKNSDCFEKSLLPFPTKNTYHALPVFGKNVYLKWKMYLLFRYTCFITCLTYYYYYDFILIIWNIILSNVENIYAKISRLCILKKRETVVKMNIPLCLLRC